MIRTGVTALLFCVIATAALAAGKEARCAQFGDMSAELVQLRLEGKSETDAILAMGEKYKDEPVDILQLIPVLSDWVFGLSKDELKGDVAGAMTAQCNEAA